MFVLKILTALGLYQAIAIFLYSLLPGSVSPLMVTGLGAFASIPVIGAMYWAENRHRPSLPTWWEGMPSRQRIPAGVMAAVLGASASIVLNSLITLSPLPRMFPSFQEEMAPVFYTPPLWQQILFTGLAAPGAEELLYRGYIYGLLRDRFSWKSAAVLSSLIFGLCHGNMVQGVYAFFMGLLAAWLFHCFRDLKAPFLFHGGANLCSVAATWLLEQNGAYPALAGWFFLLHTGMGYFLLFVSLQWFKEHLPRRKD